MANRWVRRLATGYRQNPALKGGPQVGGPGLPGANAGLGMSVPSVAPKGSKVKAATAPVRFSAPGQPLYSEWDARDAVERGYLGQTHTMRCCRIRAETLAGLPFRVGTDPEHPEIWDPHAPMALLLGPATPAAPGGPNPQTTARAFWIWSWVQRIVTGKLCWELVRESGKDSPPVQLWPLVSACLDPIPSAAGSQRWFDSYVYQTPVGRIPLAFENVMYDWRMSAKDPRQPESVLQSAAFPIQIAIGVNRYMWGLISQGMVGSTLVVAPDFEEEASRRAWEDQFNASFTGFDNAGKILFAYADNEYGADGKLADQANVSVQKLGMTSVDAQLLDMYKQVCTEIEIATGVPESLIGNASQRIYANADAEYRNFWTTTMINDVSEAQDAVNLNLSPQIDPTEVGWFDLSQVVALQPPQVFAPPQITDMLNEGVINPQDVVKILNLGAVEASGEDVATAPVGEEAISSGAVGGRGLTQWREGFRAVFDGMRIADNTFVRKVPLNTWTMRTGVWRVDQRRERAVVVDVRSVPVPKKAEHPVATDVLAITKAVQERRNPSTRGSPDSGFDAWYNDHSPALLETVEAL